MNLSDYIPVVNGAIKFHVNRYGLITLDDVWHLPVMRLALLHHWDRFSKVVGPQQLWSIFVNLGSSNNDHLFFHPDGSPYDPPTAFVKLVQHESEQTLVNHYLQQNTIDISTIVFIFVLLFFAGGIIYEIFSIPELLRIAFITNPLKDIETP